MDHIYLKTKACLCKHSFSGDWKLRLNQIQIGIANLLTTVETYMLYTYQISEKFCYFHTPTFICHFQGSFLVRPKANIFTNKMQQITDDFKGGPGGGGGAQALFPVRVRNLCYIINLHIDKCQAKMISISASCCIG